MIICIDVGNTLTDIGFFEKGKLVQVARFKEGGTLDEERTRLSLYCKDQGINHQEINGAILCSVVPLYTDIYTDVLRGLFHIEPLILGRKLKTGIRIDVPVPSEVGNDLVADCAGAKATYQSDCVIADLGTATKIIAYSLEKGFIGVSIMPGLGLGMNALSQGTAALPKVAYQVPASPLGRNTVHAIQSGLLFGTAAAIKDIGASIGKELKSPRFILTGGYAEFAKELLPSFTYDRDLLLRGLQSIYLRNANE